MPTTPDEFVQVLRAFKTKDPNENGHADEIPLTAEAGREPITRLFDLASWTGVFVNARYIENGKVTWPLKTDEAKEAVAWLRSIYAEGLIDPEIFTQDKATYMARAQQKPLIYGVACCWREGNSFGEEAALNYFVMEPLKGPSGKQMAYGTKDLLRVNNQLCVTSACKVPEIVARWVDYLYDPMIGIQTNHGPISVGSFEIIDGKYKKAVPEGYTTMGEYYVDKHFQQLPRYGPGYSDISYLDPANYIPFEYAWGGMQKRLHDDIRGPYVIDRMPTVRPTPEETEELSLLTPDFGKYANEMLTRFITGQADLESEWKKYCAELDRLGYDRILEIRQQQYDRYIGK